MKILYHTQNNRKINNQHNCVLDNDFIMLKQFLIYYTTF